MWTQSLGSAAVAWKKLWKQSIVAMAPAPKPETTGLTRSLDDATVTFGQKLQSLGRTIGDRPIPIGHASVASFAASKGLEKAGKYFEQEGFTGVVDDIGDRVKKNPLPFVAVGVGLGILLGRYLLPRR